MTGPIVTGVAEVYRVAVIRTQAMGGTEVDITSVELPAGEIRWTATAVVPRWARWGKRTHTGTAVVDSGQFHRGIIFACLRLMESMGAVVQIVNPYDLDEPRR